MHLDPAGIESDAAKAADLHQEVRRLRVRVAGLTSAALEAGAREKVRQALQELSALAADGRPVPHLGDMVLGEQLAVLLTDCLPEQGAAPPVTAEALRVAVALRGALP